MADDIQSLFKTDYSTHGLNTLAATMTERRRQDLQEEENLRTHAFEELKARDVLHEKTPELVELLGHDAVSAMYENHGMRAPSHNELEWARLNRMRGHDAAAGSASARMESVGGYPSTGRNALGTGAMGAAGPSGPQARGTREAEKMLGRPSLDEIGRALGPGYEPGPSDAQLSPMGGMPMSPRVGSNAGGAAAMLGGAGAGLGAGMAMGVDPSQQDWSAIGAEGVRQDRAMRDPRDLAAKDSIEKYNADPALAVRSRREADEALASARGIKPLEPGADDLLKYKVGMQNATRVRAQPQNPWVGVLGARMSHVSNEIQANASRGDALLKEAGDKHKLVITHDELYGAAGDKKIEELRKADPALATQLEQARRDGEALRQEMDTLTHGAHVASGGMIPPSKRAADAAPAAAGATDMPAAVKTAVERKASRAAIMKKWPKLKPADLDRWGIK